MVSVALIELYPDPVSLMLQAVPCNFEAVKEVILKGLGKDITEM